MTLVEEIEAAVAAGRVTNLMFFRSSHRDEKFCLTFNGRHIAPGRSLAECWAGVKSQLEPGPEAPAPAAELKPAPRRQLSALLG